VKKGTEHVIAACEKLPVDLDIVEGVHHDEARRRCEAADIIVDQVHTGWHGLLAIESMAMGKPVITYLQSESVARTEEAFGMKIPIVSAGPDTLLERLGELVESPEERRRIGAAGRTYVEHVHDIERVVDRLLDLYARL
jgi:glycosyltransferase involved in cell wall biosynthesis